MHKLLLVTFVALATGCSGSPTPPTTAPAHSFAWLCGDWTGSGFGGNVQELWLPAEGNAMVGVFRLMQNDAVNFYELMTIEQLPEGAVMRLKHFHADLKGWEAKDEVLTWPAEILGEHSVRFGPVDYTLTGPNTMAVVVRIKGEEDAMKLTFRRTAR